MPFRIDEGVGGELQGEGSTLGNGSIGEGGLGEGCLVVRTGHANAIGENDGVVLQTSIVGLQRSRRVLVDTRLRREVVVVSDEEEVVVRVRRIVGRDHRKRLPLLAQRVDVPRRSVDVQIELRQFLGCRVDLAEHVEGFLPRQGRDRGIEHGTRRHRCAFGVEGSVDVRGPVEFGEEDRFENRRPRRDPTAIAVAGENEELVIVEREDGALRPGAINPGRGVRVDPRKLDHILIDRIGRRVARGDIINEQARIVAVLVAAGAVLEGRALKQGEELGAVRALGDAFHSLVLAAAVQVRRRSREGGCPHGVVRNEGGGELQLPVDLAARIEVVDVGTVFVAHPAASGLGRTRIEDQALGVHGETVREGPVALGRVRGDGRNLRSEESGLARRQKTGGVDGRSARVAIVVVGEATRSAEGQCDLILQ